MTLLRSADLFQRLDRRDHFAWGALIDVGEGVAIARYVQERDLPADADTAFTVHDEYQGRGIGHLLLPALAAAGWVNGIERFHFDVLVDNLPMRLILERQGVAMAPKEPGVLHGVLDLGAHVASLDSWPPLAALARAARAAGAASFGEIVSGR